MGALAGIVYPDIFQVENLIEVMTETMSHRAKSFSYRRYKEIQIGASHLFSNQRSDLWGALDGKIDNEDALLKELNLQKNSSKKEAWILQAYEEIGVKLFEKLEGEFTLLILDQKKERFYLTRDRFGKKPLYWYRNQNFFLFSSELKALLTTGLVSQTIAEDAIASYLFLGYIPQDMSPIKKVNKLLPGHYLEFHLDRTMHINSYFSYSTLLYDAKPESEESVSDILQKAIVKRQSEESKRYFCMVHEGVEDLSVAYHLKKSNQLEGLCFAPFTDTNKEFLEQTALFFGGGKKQEDVTLEEIADFLVPMVWHLDEPVADPGALFLWQMMICREWGLEEVFSGIGGGELFFSKERYQLKLPGLSFFDLFSGKMKKLMRPLLLPLLERFSQNQSFAFLRHYQTKPSMSYFLNKERLFKQSFLKKMAPSFSHLFDIEVFLHKFYNLSLIDHQETAFRYFDMKTHLPDSALLQYDRIFSVQGIQYHTPFLDLNVIKAFASAYKNPQLLGSLLPKQLGNQEFHLQRKPINWNQEKRLMRLFRRLLQGTLIDSHIIERSYLEKLFRRGVKTAEGFEMLFSLLILEVWFRVYIDQPLKTKAPNTLPEDLLLH